MRADAWAALAAWVTAVTALATVFVAGWFANKQVKAALGQIEAARDAQRKQDEQAQKALATQARLAQETLEHDAREAQKTRDEQAQPNVVVYAEPNHAVWHMLELVVKNFGSTPAHNVKLEFDPAPRVTMGPSIRELKFPDVIPFLAPGQEWRASWDYGPKRSKHPEIESRHEAKVHFEDSRERSYTTKSVLDWSVMSDVNRLDIRTIHNVAQQLEKQNKNLADIKQAIMDFGMPNKGIWVFGSDGIQELQDRNAVAAESWRQVNEMLGHPCAVDEQSSAPLTPTISDQTGEPRSQDDPELPAPESGAGEQVAPPPSSFGIQSP